MIRAQVIFNGTQRAAVYGFPAMPEVGQRFRTQNGHTHEITGTEWVEDNRSDLAASDPIPIALEVTVTTLLPLGAAAPRYV